MNAVHLKRGKVCVSHFGEQGKASQPIFCVFVFVQIIVQMNDYIRNTSKGCFLPKELTQLPQMVFKHTNKLKKNPVFTTDRHRLG